MKSLETPTFFKPESSRIEWFETYSPKLWCLDQPPDLRGNYDTTAARTVVINVYKCNPSVRDTCKSEEEIDDFIRGKYIIILENNYKFKQENYSREDRVMKRSEMHFIPLDPGRSEELIKKVEVYDVTFQDRLLQLGELTLEDSKFFTISKNSGTRPLET